MGKLQAAHSAKRLRRVDVGKYPVLLFIVYDPNVIQ